LLQETHITLTESVGALKNILLPDTRTICAKLFGIAVTFGCVNNPREVAVLVMVNPDQKHW
jgi:hypothetical protein